MPGSFRTPPLPVMRFVLYKPICLVYAYNYIHTHTYTYIYMWHSSFAATKAFYKKFNPEKLSDSGSLSGKGYPKTED